MAEPAIDPFANGANPFRGTIDPFANGTIPFGRPGTASSGGRSSGQATIDLLQAGLDGKLPPVSGVNPFADLPPVPIGGTGSTPANGVSGAVSFTDAANPFSDLPPLPLAPSVPDSGQQTLDLINSVRNAPPENQKPGGGPYQATPSAPDAGQQTLDLINSVRMGTASTASPKSESTLSPRPGVLANAPDDNALTQAGKGAATAAIKGLGDIPGVIGNLNDVGEMAGNYLMGTARTAGQYIASKFTDTPVHSPSENAASTAAAMESGRAQMRASGAPSPSDYVPTGQTFSNPVLAKTGEYVPTSPIGRVGMAGVEAGVGAAVPVASLGETAANAAKTFVPNLVAGAAGQTASEATGNPLVGALVAPLAVHGVHAAGDVARSGVGALANAIPPLTEAQGASRARATVGSELNAAATDPGAAQAKLAAGDTSQVPGAPLTTGPLSDDVGLNVYEKAVTEGSPEAKAAYGAHLAKQNAARQNAIASVQPTGAVADLPEAVRTNAAATDTASQAAVEAAQARAAANQATVDAATKAHVEGAQEAHQTALAGIQALRPDASPLEVAQHFRVIRDALEQSGSESVASAQSAASQARSVSAPAAQNPEQVGAALRAPYEAGNAAATAKVNALYDALPKDMVAPSADIAAKAQAIQAGMLPEHSPIAGEESRLYDLASGYGDSTPLANVNALRGSILSARSTLRQSDPQAYGRLGQLLPAVDDAIDTAVENRAALDQIAVRRGLMTPQQAVQARLARATDAVAKPNVLGVAAGSERASPGSGRSESSDAGPLPSNGGGELGSRNAPGSEGVSGAPRATAASPDRAGAPESIAGAAAAPSVGDSVFTPSGRQVGVRYRVVDGKNLVTSNNPDMTPNAEYPQELQPRDRGRAASETQVSRIAGQLQPERLAASSSVGEGAPIIGPDGVVESGNGRVLGIRRAYAQNADSATKYRAYLESQGFDTAGMKEPVLVRQRTTDMTPEERVRFAQEANAGTGLALSPSERAAIDAGRLSDEALEKYQGGDVGSAENRDFVRSFMRSVPEAGEEGSFATGSGQLSLDGAQRVRNALLHAAYGDSNLVSSLAETGDENIKSFGNVLSDSAGRVAQLRRDIAAGAVHPGADLSSPLLEAARIVQKARMNGQKLSHAIAQQDAFNPISAEAEQVLRLGYGPNFDGRLSRDNMRAAIDAAATEGRQQTTEARLFGEPQSAGEILKAIGAKYGRTNEAASGEVAAGPHAVGTGDREGGTGKGQSRPSSAGQKSPDAGARGVLEEAPLTTEGDATSGPLRQANAAYRQMKQTFGEGPVGDIIARGGRGEAVLSNAQVAGRVFHAKPTAGEDARAYLKAAGPEGVDALSDAAAYSLHEAAAKDGVFDAGKATKWINDHKLALAELPSEVRGKFETVTSAQQAVNDALAKQRDTLSDFDRSEAGKVAGLENEGDVTKSIGSILDSKSAPEQRLAQLAALAKGNPAAQQGLKRALIEHVLDKFAPEGVSPKTAAMQAYVAAKEPALSKVLSPEEIKAISDSAGKATAAGAEVKAAETGRAEAMKGVAAEGEKALKTALDARKAMMAKYGDKTTLGKLAGTTSDDDAVNVVRSIIGADDGAARMASLAKEVAKTPGGTDALKKTVAEVIKREASTTTEAGTSEVMQLNRAGLTKFMAKRADALKAAGFSDAQVGALRSVTENALQTNRVVSAAKSVGSDTNFLKGAGIKLDQAGKLPMLTHIAVDSVFGAIGGGIGHMFGPEQAIAGAYAGKKLGDKVLHAVEEAGLTRIKQLRVEAVLNPDLALALMKEAPKQPNRDAAAILALRLRQMSMAGILGAQQH